MAMETPTLPPTMRAVIFDGPYQVSIQTRPTPDIQNEDDIIVKVDAAALCGSELHMFRGLEVPGTTGFIMGHEFTGTVVKVGTQVTSVSLGDKVVAPFTTSCEKLDGAQADYIRVPLANGTAVKASPEIEPEKMVLMADIFPTGFYGTRNAFNNLGPQDPSQATVVVIGCGPVGLCALVSALEYSPKHLFAIDSVESRLETARNLGAEPLNFSTDREGMLRRIKEVTDGRGADAVVEVVGLSPALRTAFEVVRPFGFISSIGVHNAEVPFSGEEAYGKNVRLQMGRCPVRSVFPDALKVLAKKQHLFDFMFKKIMPLDEAVAGYELFEKMKAQKVVFIP